MDTTQITHVSLCSGYGGIDLGLRRVIPNLRTVAYSEIEAFGIELLLARMEGKQLDAALIWSDLKTFPWAEFSGKVDILSGGYPCQPFSTAGQRKGTDDPRHLWPYIASGIRLLRPQMCFFENVEGHISLGLSSVISDLEELGYTVLWGIFSAAECGAPHQRKRVFMLALANSLSKGLQRCLRKSSDTRRLQQQTRRSGDCVWPSRPGKLQHAGEPPRVVRKTQPALGGDANGTADWLDDAELRTTCDNRTDELRLLGNGVVPATAALAFKTLIHQL